MAKEKEEMNPEDLENCDEYPLPEWWDNDNYELRPIKEGGETTKIDIGEEE